MRAIILILLCAGLAGPAAAEGFDKVDDRDRFISLVDGRKLTRFGIRLAVTPDGEIAGRAFGRDVSGAWRWRSGYFCRSLYWGSTDLGPNCQAVKVQGRTLRFISDRGQGQSADLRLR
ncbi:dihydrodipicolinate reductase [Roseovarius salinarum]|uniref:dihydrodipicolinate reductase n=1 Tax=Roseovarius salinarum TaxID=1981892 RepID=UPI000C339BEE|nr:dihydrodipicolinate reductase [Roseovarius salinarum]